MTTAARTYENFARLRDSAASVLETAESAFNSLDAGERAQQLHKSRASLLDDAFKVLIIGEFKHGKSTLINALLGQAILPAKVAPCTAVITRLRYGEHKRVLLYPRAGGKPTEIDLEKFSDALKKHLTIKTTNDLADKDKEMLESGLRVMQKTLAEASQGSNGAQESLTRLGLTVQDLGEYSPDEQSNLLTDRVSLIEDTAARAAMAREFFGEAGPRILQLITDVSASPYAYAELFYPLPLCRNNVEIVDSPGLNEHQTRTEVTRSFLGQADAIVLVLSCERALSMSELNFIDDELKDRELKDAFVLWNRFDAVRDDPQEVEDLRRRSKAHLGPRFGGEARVFYTAGRDALEGKLKGRPDLLQRSNVPAFESALEEFLAVERGRVKLRTPLRAAENAANDGLHRLIPHRESLYRQPVEEVRRKLEEQRPRLDEAERQSDRILRSIEKRGEAMEREAVSALRTLAAQLESGLARQAQLQKISTWETIKSKSDAKQKLASPLEEWMSKEVKRWQKGTLEPLLTLHTTELYTDLNEQAQQLVSNLDAAKAAFEPEFKSGPGAPVDEVTPLSRILGVGVGFVGGVGSMMEGATMGVGHAAKGLAVNLAIAGGLVLMHVGLPIILPALAAVGVYRSMTGSRRVADRLRDDAITELTGALKAKLPDMEKQLQTEIHSRMNQLREAVATGLAVQVDEVRGQVQKVIAEREQHECEAAQKIAELQASRECLLAVLERVGQIRTECEHI